VNGVRFILLLDVLGMGRERSAAGVGRDEKTLAGGCLGGVRFCCRD